MVPVIEYVCDIRGCITRGLSWALRLVYVINAVDVIFFVLNTDVNKQLRLLNTHFIQATY